MDVRDALLLVQTVAIVVGWFYQSGTTRETLRTHTNLIKVIAVEQARTISELEKLDSRVAQTHEDVSEIQRGD